LTFSSLIGMSRVHLLVLESMMMITMTSSMDKLKIGDLLLLLDQMMMDLLLRRVTLTVTTTTSITTKFSVINSFLRLPSSPLSQHRQLLLRPLQLIIDRGFIHLSLHLLFQDLLLESTEQLQMADLYLHLQQMEVLQIALSSIIFSLTACLTITLTIPTLLLFLTSSVP